MLLAPRASIPCSSTGTAPIAVSHAMQAAAVVKERQCERGLVKKDLILIYRTKVHQIILHPH
jgi:hypothetical protein